ncbi:unnamed protein product [Euphydryas editha]|uniref:DDE Tnp4 domain-containing protein n=1 Tax=Euphydryas editha TaxID=104508 RepID=A0AAU9TP66_EUPED|nr:unnamed protein product [Euphydryas editha]
MLFFIGFVLCKRHTLKTGLINASLDNKYAIGFGADTTNVMFEEQGGVIAKIRHVNPHCMFIKCVCHSTALCVSHASKNAIPRAINQIVQEVYGYFAHSSKRQKEFIVYQDFIGTEKHKILRHYEIRWLSLHACIKRILEQWDALKLFFQSQFLEVRNILSEFLFDSLNDKIYKLYFYALNYILQIVNKLNIILQGDYTIVHTAFKDISEVYMCLLSCYMKGSYLKTTDPLSIDPKFTVNFLSLKYIYLGVNVNTEIDRLLVHHVVYKDFASTFNVSKNFPNIVDESNIQKVDDELRQIKFDISVRDLLESDGHTGDSGYKLEPYLFTPILRPRNRSEEKYNEAHIATRNTVERCYGVWKQQFQCLLFGMTSRLENVKTTIVALAVLHNSAVDHGDMQLESSVENNRQVSGEVPRGSANAMLFYKLLL